MRYSMPFLLAMLTLAAMLVLPACDSNKDESVDTDSSDSETSSLASAALVYPKTPRGDTSDEFFGKTVDDPYRWLEELDSAKTQAWVKAQNELTMPYLKGIDGWEAINARLTEAWNYEKFGRPKARGGHYFYLRNDGLQDQYVLYVTHGLGDDEKQHTLLDPNTFSEDGTVSLASWKPDPTGLYLAYAKSDGGSDWNTWHVRDVETGEDLPDLVRGTKFTSASWLPDGSGFYYSRYPEKAGGGFDDSKPVAIYFHERGTDQADDVKVHASKDDSDPYGTVTEDGNYLVISLFEGYSANAVHYLDLGNEDSEIVALLDEWDALYSFLGNDGPLFYFKTTNQAPNGRVIAVDIRKPEPANWIEIIPEADEALEEVSYIGGHFVATYLKDAYSRVRVFNNEGNHVRDVQLPGIGTASGFAGTEDSTETFFSFTSFDTPTSIYRYDVATGETRLFRATKSSVDTSNFEVKQIFYPSKDGTRVPMFVIHQKGIELDGSHPTLLYGYGGFNVSKTPGFSITRSVWVEMGGIMVVANIRGGGVYGKEWHEAGTKLRKQNTFDDFIAAAEYLIDNGYTNPGKLAIRGGSNGGLLVGAVMTQRPDLFAVALPDVGVLDMLRYHLASANAYQWSSDYGLAENEDEFEALYEYSPVHNVEKGSCYPATLVTTADHDDRVVPWHSFKFAAALQWAQDKSDACNNPVLIRVETRAGHGAGKPTSMWIEEYTDRYAFLVNELGMEPPVFQKGKE